RNDLSLHILDHAFRLATFNGYVHGLPVGARDRVGHARTEPGRPDDAPHFLARWQLEDLDDAGWVTRDEQAASVVGDLELADRRLAVRVNQRLLQLGCDRRQGDLGPRLRDTNRMYARSDVSLIPSVELDRHNGVASTCAFSSPNRAVQVHPSTPSLEFVVLLDPRVAGLRGGIVDFDRRAGARGDRLVVTEHRERPLAQARAADGQDQIGFASDLQARRAAVEGDLNRAVWVDEGGVFRACGKREHATHVERTNKHRHAALHTGALQFRMVDFE